MTAHGISLSSTKNFKSSFLQLKHLVAVIFLKRKSSIPLISQTTWCCLQLKQQPLKFKVMNMLELNLNNITSVPWNEKFLIAFEVP
jgi:hypothetical protein